MDAAFIVLLFAYFLPAVIAAGRGHHSPGAVFFFNLLLGWTLLGWALALFWALAGNKRIQPARPSPPSRPRVSALRPATGCPACGIASLAGAQFCDRCGQRL